MSKMSRRRQASQLVGLAVAALTLVLGTATNAGAAGEQPPPLFRYGSPFGAVDAVVADAGVIGVAGWAIDPSAAGPIDVHIYVDGTGYPDVADYSRPDVGEAYPKSGEYHGFAVLVPASAGPHQVCVYGINVREGDNRLLGCRTITVPDASPVGSLDVAAPRPGGVTVAGWAIDPEFEDFIDVHVYVDGSGTVLTADGDRPDVEAAYTDYGPAHGFSAVVPAPPGNHTVCAYGINDGEGANSLLGCRQVAVPGGPPFGALDVAAPSAGGVRVAGWAIDPDTAAPIDVHVYVDGSGVTTTADASRPDVAAAFPSYGAAHGYDLPVGASPGTHQVCAYGINVATGSNSLIGCRPVTVPQWCVAELPWRVLAGQEPRWLRRASSR